MGIESGTLPIQCSSQWVICGNSTELADGDWEWNVTYWKFIAMDYLVVNAKKRRWGIQSGTLARK